MSIYDKASLVLIPSGTKTSKVYSQKPTNGDGDFTFSRSTAATRVNASGNIEKETSNLLLRSNNFGNTWNNINTTETSGQSGYDGSSDAWRINLNSGTATKLITQSITALSGVYTASFYAKAGTHSIVQIGTSAQSNIFVSFDLSDGSVGSLSANAISAKATDVGGSWYRIEVAFLSSNANGVSIAAVDSLSATRFQSTSSTGDFYIQDAQLEQGLVARSYNETTTSAFEGGITDNVPRLDYSGGATCPSILLEGQRTNLVTHSEYFGDSSWSKTSAGGGSNAVVTDNYGVSPEGLQNAARLQLNLNGGTSASDISYIAYYYAATGVATTNSVYMKSLSGTTNVRIRCGSTFESVDVTTDWQRFDVTDSSTSDRFQVLIYGGINSDTADLLIWGAQGEAGSYATSYIPTYGSAVTRNVDSCSKTGVSSLIGQTEGTLFAEFEIKSTNTDNFNRIIAIGDGTSNNRIMIFANNDEKPRAFISDSGATQVSIIGNTSILGGTHKIAFAYKANDFVLYMDGVSLGTDTSGSVPSLSNIYLASAEDSNIRPIEGGLKQALVFKTRLTNAELADLTTL